MKEEYPKEFYKYTSSLTTKKILNTSKLKWSSPLLFNDINEFNIYPTFSPTIEESWIILLNSICDLLFEKEKLNFEITPNLLIYIKSVELLKQNGFSKEDILSKLSDTPITTDVVETRLKESIEEKSLNSYRVLSLTEEFDNELMWSHYSDNHYGCLLSFQPIKELDSPFSECKKVDYVEGNRVIGSGLDIILNQDFSTLNKETIQSICFTKSHMWSYEKEWRLITRREYSENDFDYFKFYPQELKSVTFGVRTSISEREEILKILKQKYPNTEIYEMINDRKLEKVLFK